MRLNRGEVPIFEPGLEVLMTKNIIIIGSSGAIGSSFLKYYENENTDNIIYSLSRKPYASPSDKIINVPVDIEDESSISSASNLFIF